MQEKYELPESWEWTTLPILTDNLDSRRIPINNGERNDRIEGKEEKSLVPYYGATGQVGYIDTHLFDEELLLLGEDAAPFYDPFKPVAYLVNGKSWVNNHAHILRANESTSNRFILHYLNQFDFHGFVTGTTRLKLTQQSMNTIPVCLPPLPEQRRIVAKLEELFSRLDAGVATLRQTQAQLKRYRQSVLHAAVTGELTRAWRAAHPAPAESGAALLERIRQERRAQWEAAQLARRGGQLPLGDAWKKKYEEPAAPETSELPELPEGWAWVRFEQIIIDGPQNGLYLPSSLYGSGTPIVRIDDYQSDWSRSSDKLRLVKCSKEESDKYGLRIGDIVINRVNSMSHIGKSFVVEARHIPAIYESNMMRLSIGNETFPAYINLYLRSRAGRSRLTGNAKQAVNQASINQNDVNSTTVPFPSLAEQKQIVAEVESRLSVLDNLELTLKSELTRAERLRQSILHRAFTGRLVPQDAAEEPAAALLARLQAEPAAAPAAKGKRGRKPKTADEQLTMNL